MSAPFHHVPKDVLLSGGTLTCSAFSISFSSSSPGPSSSSLLSRCCCERTRGGGEQNRRKRRDLRRGETPLCGLVSSTPLTKGFGFPLSLWILGSPMVLTVAVFVSFPRHLPPRSVLLFAIDFSFKHSACPSVYLLSLSHVSVRRSSGRSALLAAGRVVPSRITQHPVAILSFSSSFSLAPSPFYSPSHLRLLRGRRHASFFRDVSFLLCVLFMRHKHKTERHVCRRQAQGRALSSIFRVDLREHARFSAVWAVALCTDACKSTRIPCRHVRHIGVLRVDVVTVLLRKCGELVDIELSVSGWCKPDVSTSREALCPIRSFFLSFCLV